MASANMNGLTKMYGEDILEKVKGCEFHFKQSIERKVKRLTDEQSHIFKDIAIKMLESQTPEAYNHTIDRMKKFIEEVKGV